jgi:hypothetical protein
MFIIVLTYVVATFSEASMVVDFLKDQEELIGDDPNKLIAATAVANIHDGSDVYVLKEPLYTQTFSDDSTSDYATISIYSYVVFKENETKQMIAILVTDLNIDNAGALLDDNDYHQLQATISFNDAITINDYTASSFDETFVTAFEDETKLIFIDVALFKTTDITKIEVMYTTDTGLETTFISLGNSNYVAVNANDIFDNSFDRDIKNVMLENIDIASIYGVDQYQNENNIYYDGQWLETLSSYNYYYFRNAGFELLFLLPITYLIFFRKQMKKKLKTRKLEKEEKTKKEKEDLKNMFRES